ncbi:clathrin adaptor complexes medium subunit family protein [Actinidia rufa]|uniref:Clathrin adaptor complexes medium subunit family protein n=1 Tax=Actinidia rufa TaxID=165716 RepID=A0A7J0G8V9_9ERIC|nr:clathrin adaptor complexes medium subunit family protein [Actinidia rufa]
MIDNGFPLTTEPNILRQMIASPNIVSKMLSVATGNSSNVSNTLPDATASCVPWRITDLKHTNNEVYVDLVEEMDAIINSDGALVKCEINGEVQVNSHLSGLPDLTLSFANPSILNDVRFHPCVRFRPWESHQILSFVPPDGQFKLMSYRSNVIHLQGQKVEEYSDICKATANLRFWDMPYQCFADLTSNHGAVNILANKTCSWSIGRIPKDKAPSMSGTLALETDLERLNVFPTFSSGFQDHGCCPFCPTNR